MSPAMMNQNWVLALPEIVLALCAMAILVFGVLWKKSNPAVACSMMSVAALLLTAVLVISAPLGTAYHGLFSVDRFAVFAKLLILAGAAMSLIMAMDYNRRTGIERFEFPVLILLCSVGMMIMTSATNLMSLYIGLELQSLPIYVMAAFNRDNVRSSEAGLKYFVLGALASGLLLYGSSLAYGFAGSMDFGDLSHAFAQGTPAAGLVIGVVFIVAGLAFKISAVPFHMWTPDVYEGAPTAVTAFMATAPKVAAMSLLLRVLEMPFGHLSPQWTQLVVLISIASMLLGSLAAIGQTSIKRLMAYSSIGHMGYALIGLAAGTQAGIQGVLVYLVTYVFMSAGVFACIIAMRRKGLPLEKISDLSGLARTDPMLAAAFGIFMFSMAGIPPFSGFFGKLYVFYAAVQAGYWTLSVIGVLTSVIGAYYYLRVVKIMYMDEAQPAFDVRSPSLSFVAGVGALVTALFFIFPAPIVGAAQAAAAALF
jgi:NADH-quinone oxidoreductase subunit N